MTRTEWLLAQLASECSELAKECLKAQQFGLNGSDPVKPTALNSQRIANEYQDVGVVMTMLQNHTNDSSLSVVPWTGRQRYDKVMFWMQVAIDKGIINE